MIPDSTDRYDIAIIGGSVAGLATALFAARTGLRVAIVDRDRAVGEPASEPDTNPRRAVPQARHSHIFLARLRLLLAERAPDVLDRLHAAGVHDLPLRDGRPPALVGVDHPAFADPDLVALASRRTPFEAVVREVVLAEPNVTVRAGAAACDVVTGDEGDGALHVVGIELDDGSVVHADLVVDASGRRTPVPAWLDARGVAPRRLEEDCGISYLSRYYRLRPGQRGLSLERGYTAGASFDRYSCLVFPGDADTFSVTFGILPEDRDLRGLSGPDAFDAAVSAIPSLAPWVEPSRSFPISDVATMSGMQNRIRRWVVDGRPVVLGLASVGDAAATSNPAHSRGTTLAFVHAAATVDALAAADGDAGSLALALDGVLCAELAPWIEDSRAQDAARLARWRPDAAGARPAPASTPERLTNAEAYGAAQHDPELWRTFSRLQQLLCRPDDVLADPDVVARVRAVGPPPSFPVVAPSHDELADLIVAAGGGRRRAVAAST